MELRGRADPDGLHIRVADDLVGIHRVVWHCVPLGERAHALLRRGASKRDDRGLRTAPESLQVDDADTAAADEPHADGRGGRFEME
eukprot:scaffold319664_cov36-Tisochrysis_lutea.AAC.5